MAADADFGGPLAADYPGMDFVTVETVQSLLHVETVLPYRRFIGMAFGGANGRIRYDLPVRLMTLVTGKTGHGDLIIG